MNVILNVMLWPYASRDDSACGRRSARPYFDRKLRLTLCGRRLSNPGSDSHSSSVLISLCLRYETHHLAVISKWKLLIHITNTNSLQKPWTHTHWPRAFASRTLGRQPEPEPEPTSPSDSEPPPSRSHVSSRSSCQNLGVEL